MKVLQIMTISLCMIAMVGILPAFAEYQSPLKQLESGVTPEEIQCKDNRVLVLRANGSPACVTEKTAERTGWEIINENILTNTDVESQTSTKYLGNVSSVDENRSNTLVETLESQKTKIATTETLTNPIQTKEFQVIESKIDLDKLKINSSERLILSFDVSPTVNSYASQGKGICKPIQPSSVNFPSSVNIGEEFKVIFEYSLVAPDKGTTTDYEGWEERIEKDECNVNDETYGIHYILPDYFRILDDRNIIDVSTHMWNVSPASIWNWGYVKLDFNNTLPQTETITMKIDDPRLGNEVDQIRFAVPFAELTVLTILFDDNVVTFSEPPYYERFYGLKKVPAYGMPMEMAESTYYEELRIAGYNAPILFSNHTYNLEGALSNIDSVPVRYAGVPPRAIDGNPPSVDAYAEFVKINSGQYKIENRVSSIERSAEFSHGQEWLDEFKEKYPEIWTQEKLDVAPDFPRDIVELATWLKSKPNGFAEIYLNQNPLTENQIANLGKHTPNLSQYQLDTINHHRPDSYEFTISGEINSIKDLENLSIEEQVYAVFPHIQTTDEHRSIVDKFSKSDFDLELQNFFSIFYSILPLAYAQSYDESFVYGKFNDLNGNDISNIRICAYDVTLDSGDKPTGEFTALNFFNTNNPACELTGSSGGFSLQVPTADPDNDGTTTDVTFRIFAENDEFQISKYLNGQDRVWSNGDKDENIVKNISATVKDYGTIILDKDYSLMPQDLFIESTYNYDDFLDMTKILFTLDDTFDWYQSELGYTPDSVKINYDPAFCGGTSTIPYDDASGDAYTMIFLEPEDRPAHQTNEIGYDCSTVNDANFPDTIRHEYAHHNQFIIYKENNGVIPANDCASQHSPNSVGGLACGWIEGFATFMSLAYNNDGGIYWGSAGLGIGSYNYEDRTGGGTAWADGAENEGNVAGALYDLIDTTNESGDVNSNLSSDIWKTLTDTRESDETVIAASFNDFYDDWQDSNRPDIETTLIHNTVISAPIPPPPSQSSLDEDFETDLSNWLLSGDDNWVRKLADLDFDNQSHYVNDVATSSNCDDECILTLYPVIDLTSYDKVELSLWRFVDGNVDDEEGLRVQVSPDGGNTWIQVADWSEDSGHNNNEWTFEPIDITSYNTSTNFKVRFIATSSSGSEEIKIDNVKIATPIDDPPVLNNISNVNMDENQSKTINISSSDVQDHAISLSLVVNPTSFVTLTDNGLGSGTITLSPDYDDIGTYTITVQASANGLTDTKSFDVTVNDVIDYSQFITISNPTPEKDDNFGFYVASTPDGNILTVARNDNTGATNSGSLYLIDGTDGSILLTINNPEPNFNDKFGRSIASTPDGNILVGVSSYDDSGQKNAGIVYLFDGTNGDLLLTINNPTHYRHDQFGDFVTSTTNGNILVGAKFSNTGALDTGSVYLFDGSLRGTTDTPLLTINNPTPEIDDYFGRSIASTPDGNILVGARNDNTGVTSSGTVYLFDGTNGNLLLTINNPTPHSNDQFSHSMEITSDGNILVGARNDITGAGKTGSVYLFDGTDGILLLTINNPTPDYSDQFGSFVTSTPDGMILVGALKDNTGATNAGSVYIFDGSLRGTTDTPLFTINNPTPEEGDKFGRTIAYTSDGLLVIGGTWDNANGINSVGSVYVYTP